MFADQLVRQIMFRLALSIERRKDLLEICEIDEANYAPSIPADPVTALLLPYASTCMAVCTQFRTCASGFQRLPKERL